MRLWFGASLALGGIVCAACAAFTASDGTTSAGLDAGAEAAADDAGAADATVADGTADVADAGPIVFEDDFDGTPGLPCAGWQSNGATALVVADAGFDGGGACRICATTAANGTVVKNVASPTAGNYTLLFKIRKDPTIPAGSFASAVVFGNSDGGENASSYAAVTPANGWFDGQSGTATVETTNLLLARFYALGVQTTCTLVDDVKLVRQ